MNALYPWLAQDWQRLQQLYQLQQMPHAILLHGLAGLGKVNLARQLSQLLLCSKAEGTACGQCRACHLFTEGNHPDFTCLSSDEEKSIKVDMIRAIEKSLFETTTIGVHKVILIYYAELMNRNAANALLKMLEEPPENTFFILVTNQLQAIIPTIRSRLRQWRIDIADSAVSQRWLIEQGHSEDTARFHLALCQYAPLAAYAACESDAKQHCLQLLQDLVAINQQAHDFVEMSKRWQALELSALVTYCQIIAQALFKQQSNTQHIFSADETSRVLVEQLSTQWSMAYTMRWFTNLCEMKQKLRNNATLNHAYFVDALMANLTTLERGRN